MEMEEEEEEEMTALSQGGGGKVVQGLVEVPSCLQSADHAGQLQVEYIGDKIETVASFHVV